VCAHPAAAQLEYSLREKLTLAFFRSEFPRRNTTKRERKKGALSGHPNNYRGQKNLKYSCIGYRVEHRNFSDSQMNFV